MKSRFTAALTATAALLALGFFLVRGPARALVNSGDFGVVYTASLCWAGHGNPYSQSDLIREYPVALEDPLAKPDLASRASIYPPSIFPLLSVFGTLGWTGVKRAWLMVNLIAFAASLVCIYRALPPPGPRIAAGLFVACLLFSPVHTGLTQGQPSVLCISLLTCAFYLPPFSGRKTLSGILLGVSCCLKPNIAIPYILFCCWRRQWHTALVSVATTIPVLAIAIWKLQLLHQNWWSDWMENLRTSSLPGGGMDPTLANPSSYLLVNFQTVAGFFGASQPVSDAITYSLAGMAILWVVNAGKCLSSNNMSTATARVGQAIVPADPLSSGSSQPEGWRRWGDRIGYFLTSPNRMKSDDRCWLLLAFLSVIVLLGSYHRYYDLQLLLLGTKGFLQVRWSRAMQVVISILLLTLWIPIQAIAGFFLDHPLPGAKLPAGQWMLDFLAFCSHPLALTGLGVLLAWAISKSRAEGTLA